MEISSFLSTNPEGTECCVAPANALVQKSLDEEGTEALAAGFAALFRLMLAPTSPVSDPAAASSTVEAASSPGTPGIQPSAAASVPSLPAGTVPAGKPDDSFSAAPASAEIGPGESPASHAAVDASAAESVTNSATNGMADALPPTAVEPEPAAPSPPQRADLFLSERQTEPTTAPSVPREPAAAAAVPMSPSETRQDTIPSASPNVASPNVASPDVATQTVGRSAADSVRGAASNPETAAPPDAVADPAPLAPFIPTVRLKTNASRSAAAIHPSGPLLTAEDASATGPQPTGPESSSSPQPASLAFDAAAEWSPEASVEGTGSEPPRESRPFEDPEPESWFDSMRGAGSDGTVTIQELAAWQTFGREQGFEHSRQETADDTLPAGPVRKTAENTSGGIDSQAAAVSGSLAREAAAGPAVISQGALPSFAVEEIVSHVRTEESNGVSRVEARIDPPELGRMWIEITRSAEGVKAHLTVEDPAVWHLLETAAAEMRDSLQNSGVPMTGLTLSLGGDGARSQTGGSASGGNPNGESRRDEDFYAPVAGAAQRRGRPKRPVDTIV